MCKINNKNILGFYEMLINGNDVQLYYRLGKKLYARINKLATNGIPKGYDSLNPLRLVWVNIDKHDFYELNALCCTAGISIIASDGGMCLIGRKDVVNDVAACLRVRRCEGLKCARSFNVEYDGYQGPQLKAALKQARDASINKLYAMHKVCEIFPRLRKQTKDAEIALHTEAKGLRLGGIVTEE